ncbi:MAG: response regulator [Bacteroidales bacterium]|nr:response regulator [Bacteroidales bacterium]
MTTENFSILYVDDEEHNLISFKATFRLYYKIYTAISGEKGLDILHSNHIDLIITDQRMPDMTGIQFLEKTIPEFPDAIRMILTGFSDIGVIIDAINNLRIFRYITKPWDEHELRMTIENARQVYELNYNNRDLMFKLQQKVEEQQEILNLFIKYVPEQIVKKSLQNNQASIFEGELRNVAILFCDIRGFTSISEELSPSEVVSFLNDYYRIMSDVVKQYKGSVNQFVGDEIFAAFGAPESCPDNERNAVFCAMKMMESLQKLNDKYEKKIKRDVQMGIGVNSGEVVAGNVGSEDRIEYHMTGGTVNTGKRIETLTKDYPNAILISESVYEQTKEMVQVKAWEPILVKGKKESIRVYEVLGRK